MSDYTVLWDGRGPLTSSEGWTQRNGSYLTAAAEYEGVNRKELPSQQEMIGKTTLTGLQVREAPTAAWMKTAKRCACGRLLTERAVQDHRTRCWKCQKTRRSIRKQAA